MQRRRRRCHPLLQQVGSGLSGMYLQVQLARTPAELDWLVDHGHLRMDRHAPVQPCDIVRVKTHAAMAVTAADAVRPIGAVNGVAGPRQVKREITHGVVRPRRHTRGQFRFVCALRRGRHPHRPTGFANDGGTSGPGLPACPADAEGETFHVALRIMIEAQFREVDDDAAARRIRQDMFQRKDHQRVFLRKPGVEPRIGGADLGEAEVMTAGDLEQRIAGADHILGAHGRPGAEAAGAHQHDVDPAGPAASSHVLSSCLPAADPGAHPPRWRR